MCLFLRCDSRRKMRANFTTFFGWHFNFLWVLLICIFIFYVCYINYELFHVSNISTRKEKGTNVALRQEKWRECCKFAAAMVKKRRRTNLFLKKLSLLCWRFFVSYACPENLLLYTFWIKNCSNVPSIPELLFTCFSSAQWGLGVLSSARNWVVMHFYEKQNL